MIGLVQRPPTAHPRSRGENPKRRAIRTTLHGSSPLTRGKPGGRERTRSPCGLIPAHAGKTRKVPLGASGQAAHPRSRGENHLPVKLPYNGGGSSPLTRGKRGHEPPRRRCPGLIPAHAGKTSDTSSARTKTPAHPRSRGENSARRRLADLAAGSSPLTRGKRDLTRLRCQASGLIPAHAGKTLPDLRFYCADRSDLGNP